MKKINFKDKYLISFLGLMIIFVLSVLMNTLLPLKYEIPVLLLAIGILMLGILSKSKWMKVILSVILAVGSAGLIYSQSVAHRLLEQAEFDSNSFVFLVLMDSPIQTIAEAKESQFAHAKTLANGELEFIKEHMIEKHDITMNLSEFNNELDMVESLFNDDVDVMIVDGAIIPLLEDEDEFFLTKVRVIYSINYETIRENIGKDVEIDKEAFIIFISGIDIEGPINSRSRSDVNILMVVNPTKQKILTISIPRDTYVNLGCRTGEKDKLTHAGIYGIGCSVNTIENLFDIEINYYVRVNFTSVINIVDIIGDIDVYSRFAFSRGGFTFKQGINTLNSQATLVFARERYLVPGGDITRGLNQQEVIKGLVNKIIEPSSLLRIEEIVRATASSIDTNMPSSDLTRLIRLQLDQNIKWNFESMHLEGRGDSQPTYSMGSRLLYVMHPDQNSLQAIQRKIAETLK